MPKKRRSANSRSASSTSKPATSRKKAKAVASLAKPKALPANRPTSPGKAPLLKRPAVLKGDPDNFLLVLTDAPDRIDGYELAQMKYDGNEGAGDITPPTGLGKMTFGQDLMDDTFGDVPIAMCRKGLPELKVVVRDHGSVLGFEKGGVVYELSESEFLAAVQAAPRKFIRFVHVEDE